MDCGYLAQLREYEAMPTDGYNSDATVIIYDDPNLARFVDEIMAWEPDVPDTPVSMANEEPALPDDTPASILDPKSGYNDFYGRNEN